MKINLDFLFPFLSRFQVDPFEQYRSSTGLVATVSVAQAS